MHPSVFLVQRAHRSTKAKNLVISAKLQAKKLKEDDSRQTLKSGVVQEKLLQKEEWEWEQAAQEKAGALKVAGGAREGVALGIEMETEVGAGAVSDEDAEVVEEAEQTHAGAAAAEVVVIRRQRSLSQSLGATAVVASSSALEDAMSTYAYTQMLGEIVRGRMRDGTYEPKVDSAVRACLRQLPWWQESDQFIRHDPA